MTKALGFCIPGCFGIKFLIESLFVIIIQIMKNYHGSYKYYVYIMASDRNGTLYTGITNDIARRSFEHKTHFNKNSFSSRYNVNKLVYMEVFENPEYAITREKQIKSWSREKKIDLIESINSNWVDLFDYLNC